MRVATEGVRTLHRSQWTCSWDERLCLSNVEVYSTDSKVKNLETTLRIIKSTNPNCSYGEVRIDIGKISQLPNQKFQSTVKLSRCLDPTACAVVRIELVCIDQGVSKQDEEVGLMHRRKVPSAAAPPELSPVTPSSTRSPPMEDYRRQLSQAKVAVHDLQAENDRLRDKLQALMTERHSLKAQLARRREDDQARCTQVDDYNYDSMSKEDLIRKIQRLQCSKGSKVDRTAELEEELINTKVKLAQAETEKECEFENYKHQCQELKEALLEASAVIERLQEEASKCSKKTSVQRAASLLKFS
ncbi:hypothetical protein GNI_020250 [Gregarina niphandrodes]|uniref:C2 NT-type domain-containing protein n=1 Tax=Gregarina niphandrodes TaxID=110365 RepID=A0A023BBS6_GRENI|nr:hypothetical protein GNI_020250 [Gregarina niphandrodes]EZG81075.1 hypothetical protein GNI_020250 [Gregarina niphandrodes]|eukprot:XP_011134271.1 hypothetical protein GNI_020250 [Gregarina niphandrodes]